jgi:hypothetical protein
MLAATLIAAAQQVHADTFRIEIDYMVNADHSHMPSADVVDAVVQMFACQGHTLIIDVSDALQHYNVLQRDPEDCEADLFTYSGSAASFGAIKENFADHSSGDGWHYCIFGHQYQDTNCMPSGSSGLGERPGWNFVVTLGGWDNDVGTEFEQAATLAHEFGHNLGQTHCGTGDCTSIGDYPPILPSIMSYRYQLAGVRTNLVCNDLAVEEALFKEIDYSHGRMCSMNENDLDEPFGTGMTEVDWNCDGNFTTGVMQDIGGDRDGWCDSTGDRGWVNDKNEWASVSDPARGGGGRDSQEVSCITWREWQEVKREMAARGGCSQPVLTVEACQGGKNVYISSANPPGFGDCEGPFHSVQAAHDESPSGSVFFLRPLIYNDTSVYGTVALDTPGTYLSNIGVATIK